MLRLKMTLILALVALVSLATIIPVVVLAEEHPPAVYIGTAEFECSLADNTVSETTGASFFDGGFSVGFSKNKVQACVVELLELLAAEDGPGRGKGPGLVISLSLE